MIKHSYLFLHMLLLFLLSVVITAVFVLSRPETVQYLADRFLKEQGIGYEHIEGSLLRGVMLYDVTYQEALTIKTLTIDYQLPFLLRPSPRINTVIADQVTVIPGKFPLSDSNDTQLSLPSFSINSLSLTRLTVIMDENITLDLHAENISIRDTLDVETLAVKLDTAFANVVMQGRIETDTLFAETSVTPAGTLLDLAHPFVQGLPDTIDIDLTATLNNVMMSTQFDKLLLTADENLTLQQISLDLNYFINHDYFTFKTAYDLGYDEFETKIEQEGLFTLNGAYSSKAEGTLTKHTFHLPFKTFNAEAAGDHEAIVAGADAGPLELSAKSEDYAIFSLYGRSSALELSFYPDLPDLFKDNTIAFEANATLELSPFSIEGDLFTEGNNTHFEGDFDIDEKSMLYKATVHPKPRSPLFQDFPIEKFSPMHIVFYGYPTYDLLNIDANLLNLTLFQNRSGLNGWGNFATTTFKAGGSIEDNGDMNLTLSSSTPSLYALVSTFMDLELGDYEFYDAQLDINTTLSLTDTMEITANVNLPWYVAQLNSQTYYFGEDLFIEASAEDEQLYIDRYRLDIMQHSVYSERPSRFSVDKNTTVHLKSFWIYDNLLLTGSFNPLSQNGTLSLSSDRFHYEGAEGNITAKVDISANFDENLTQNIEGEIVILDGVITASPKNDYAILDEDIIIIQDVKAPSKAERSINIVIGSASPVIYRHDGIEVEMVPEFTLYQEPFKPLQLLGMVHVNKGEIKTGDKHFYMQEGDIFLQGDSPVNPYLNLHLKYTTLDYIDIGIIVTNTLNAPIIVFTSSPPMSQDDILSYLLFGGPATSTFESSDDGSTSASVGSMLLGTGLKTIFTDTTGIQVDTLNILTDKEGDFGYEIGTRFSKDIRLVYKNDTISSVILQYSLNKWVRIDVDIHETGQGVNLLYIKDF